MHKSESSPLPSFKEFCTLVIAESKMNECKESLGKE